MSASWARDLRALVLVSASLLLVLALAEALRVRRASAVEGTRKLVHVVCGAVAAGFPWIFAHVATVVLLSSGFLALMILTRRRRRLRAVHAVGRRTGGGLYFPCGVAATFALAGDRPAAYAAALLVLACGDAAAAVVGRRFGRHRYCLGGAPKSLEGSLALVAVSTPVILACLVQAGGLPFGEAALWACGAAGLAALLEAAAPEGSDNVILPVATALVLRQADQAEPARLATLVLVLSAAAVLASLLATLRRAPLRRERGRAGFLGVRGAAWVSLARGGPLC